MTAGNGDLVFLWLLNFCLHSSLLLGMVWVIDRNRLVRSAALLEWLWRAAILASLVSATLSLSQSKSSLYGFTIEQTPAVQLTQSPETGLSKVEPVERGGKPLRLDPAYNLLDQPNTVDTVKNDIPFASDSISRTPVADIHRDSTDQPGLQTFLMYTWLLLVAGLICRLAQQYRRAHTKIGDRRQLPDEHPATIELNALWLQVNHSSELKNRPVLTVSDELISPVTLSGREICLPGWTLTDMDSMQRRAVLAHELAHCLRHDPLWFVALDVIQRCFFFHPLMHLARHKLIDLAEIRADETAVELTGDHRAVAESLTECASHYQPQHMIPGVAMANRPSSFINRIERLLSRPAGAIRNPGRRTISLMVIGMFVLAIMMPGFMYSAQAARSGTSTHIDTDRDGKLDNMSMSISRDGYRLEVDADGHFELNDDESDLARLDRGAELEIEETVDGSERRVEFNATRSGIERRVWIDGDEQEFDENTRSWLSELLPRVMRETGLNAEKRAARIHARSGSDGLLDEIQLIRGDYSTRRYIVWLARNDELDETQYGRLLKAAATVDSDYEMRQSLMQIAGHQRMSDDRAIALLDVGAAIDSDYELRTLVDHLVTESDIEKLAADRLIEVISSIDSDYEMRTAFMTMLHDADLTHDELNDTLGIASRMIDSDYELRVLLDELSDGAASDEELALGYLTAVRQIDSDYERRVALNNLVKQADGLEDIWVAVIETAAGIDGDYELAESLVAIADQMPSSDANREAYRNAAMRIGGQYERKRALDAIGG